VVRCREDSVVSWMLCTGVEVCTPECLAHDIIVFSVEPDLPVSTTSEKYINDGIRLFF